MTLATHAVVGIAVASLLPRHPLLGFIAAFISHFIVDAIPHGHYRLSSRKRNLKNPLEDDMIIGRDFIFDLAKIGFDALTGLAISAIFIAGWQNWMFIPTLSAGTVGGVLPDALQFAYWKIRREPLVALQKFHIWMHAKKCFDGKFLAVVAVEAATILASVILVRLIWL